MQSSAELEEEIATLEAEIINLERNLLSLYRTAFKGHLSTLSDTPGPYLEHKIGSSPKLLSDQLHHNMETHVSKGDLIHHEGMSPAHGWASSDSRSYAVSLKSTSSRVNMPPFFDLDLFNKTSLLIQAYIFFTNLCMCSKIL